MTPFDWNGLQRGDVVFVHDTSASRPGAESGTVRFVEVVPSQPNKVGIRLARSEYVMVWPPAAAVHREDVAPAGCCLRCDAAAAPR